MRADPGVKEERENEIRHEKDKDEKDEDKFLNQERFISFISVGSASNAISCLSAFVFSCISCVFCGCLFLFLAEYITDFPVRAVVAYYRRSFVDEANGSLRRRRRRTRSRPVCQRSETSVALTRQQTAPSSRPVSCISSPEGESRSADLSLTQGYASAPDLPDSMSGAGHSTSLESSALTSTTTADRDRGMIEVESEG